MIETITTGDQVVGFDVIFNCGQDRHRCDTREQAEAYAHRLLMERLHRHYYTSQLLRYVLNEGAPAGGSDCADELDWYAVRDLAKRAEEEATVLAFDGPAVSLLGAPARHEDGRVDAEHLAERDPLSIAGIPLSPYMFESMQTVAQKQLEAAQDAAHKPTRPAFSEVAMKWLAEDRPAVTATEAAPVWLMINHAMHGLPGAEVLRADHAADKVLPEPAVAAFRAGLAALYDQVTGAVADVAAAMLHAPEAPKRTRAERAAKAATAPAKSRSRSRKAG